MSELTLDALAALKGAVAVFANGPNGIIPDTTQTENFDQLVANYKKRGRKNSSLLRLQEEEREFKTTISAEAPLHALVQGTVDVDGPKTSPREGVVAALTRSRSKSQLISPTVAPIPTQRRPSLTLAFPAVVVVDQRTQSTIKDQTIEAIVGLPPDNTSSLRSSRPGMMKHLAKLTVNTNVTVYTLGTAKSLSINSCGSEELFLADCFVDILKLLHYESKFCVDKKLPIIDKHYFLGVATEPYRQFYYFSSLVCWLMSLCGASVTYPKEYDDPSITVSTLATELKKLNLGIDIVSGKLKQGYGEHVMQILYQLSLNASQTVKIMTPSAIPDRYPGDMEVESSEQGRDDEIHEEHMVNDHEDDEFSEYKKHNESKTAQISESAVDPNAWKIELERVRPLLQTIVKMDDRSWRSHFDTMRDICDGMGSDTGDTMDTLGKVSSDVKMTTEKIVLREKTINSQMEKLTAEYRAVHEEMTKKQETYGRSSEKLVQFSQELNQINDELDRTKRIMDELSTSISDATPVVKIKSSMSQIKNELKSMEVRVGVALTHLISCQTKETASLKSTMHSRSRPDARFPSKGRRDKVSRADVDSDDEWVDLGGDDDHRN